MFSYDQDPIDSSELGSQRAWIGRLGFLSGNLNDTQEPCLAILVYILSTSR